jgi:hypothetical protein
MLHIELNFSSGKRRKRVSSGFSCEGQPREILLEPTWTKVSFIPVHVT